jgi:sugar lactone lactonase YvrE
VLVLLGACDRHVAPSSTMMQEIGAGGSAGVSAQAGATAGSGGRATVQAGSGGRAALDAAIADDAALDDDAGTVIENDAAVSPDPSICPDGFARGTAGEATRRIAILDPSPEGVGACANGDVFAGAGEQLWRIPLDGKAPEPFATLPGRSLEGIVCDDRGRIFVADISALAALVSGAPPALPPAVLMLEGDGTGEAVPLVLEDPPVQLTGYNGLLWVPERGIYTTDMGAGLIVRFEEVALGAFEGSVAQDGLPGANGLAYDARSKTLYVVLTGMLNDTGVADSSVESFPLHDDGTLGARRTVWTSPNWLDGADGLAIDDQGVLYRANQLSGTVSRMSDEAVVAHVPNPASLAFRGGTLLISDFKILGPLQGPGGVYAVDLGVCGGPFW